MTNQTHVRKEFSLPMIVSTSPNTSTALAPVPQSSEPNVIWKDVFQPKDVPIPADFEDIDAIVTRDDTNQTRHQHLKVARSALATRMPEKVIGLAALRLKRGMSQQRLAKELGTSQPYIARLEVGQEDIMMGTARKLAKVLEVSLSDIDAALLARGKTS